MNLFLYRLLLFIALPLVAYEAIKRCKKAKQLNDVNLTNCFKSRFGLNPQKFSRGGVWIHAVSVGETRSIFPLLKALNKQYPKQIITVTSGSTQGAVQALKFSPVKIQHQMIPYDYPFAVNKFLQQIQPRLVIMIETEIWPNLYDACYKQNIPIVLANARLKQKSMQSYQKYGKTLIADALNKTKFIAAQFQQDADNFIKLGADKELVKILGNIKSDIEIPADLPSQITEFKNQHKITNRFIWVAASTHGSVKNSQAEEELILKAHQRLLKIQPNALLIIAPRHPERFTEVAKILENTKLAIRSKNEVITEKTQVYLADSVGEMMLWFKLANVAFIGGSLVPFGGHNIMEPAALGKTTISGKYFQNLQALFNQFQQQNAVIIAQDELELANILINLAKNPSQQEEEGNKSYQCFKNQTGSINKLIKQLEIFIKN
jgi:3-deoxy-D-manno-octulosonic-acid transferase